MDIATLNISEKETVVLRCVRCGNSRQISTGELRPDIHLYKIKCKCGAAYYMQFNRRKFTRKNVTLKGTYSMENRMNDEIVDIVNLSRTGLCFFTHGRIYLTKGQTINLRFVLDNAERESIECKAIIRRIKDHEVGVEFVNLPPIMQKRLSFYLFN